ncbi:MAG: hypothetical protein M9904_06645 [Chitinophagaceae bacterium]|nr:hypothetical protein [Chitinophagaceae bacterium]
MESDFGEVSLTPFEILRKIDKVFPDNISIKTIFDNFDWVNNNLICMEIVQYLAQENLISKVSETNYQIKDAGRAAIKEGSLEKYFEKINAEKTKMDELKALQEQSLKEGIIHSRKMREIAEDANKIAKNANIKANSSNVIAIISAIVSIVSVLFTCNKQ